MSMILALGLISLQGVTLVDGPKPDTKGIAVEYGSGVCRVSAFGKDGDGEQIRAEFSRRLRDGNFGVSLYGPFMQKFGDENPDTNHPVTVTFGSDALAPTRSGGYDVGGFRQYIWGGWGPGAASDAAYEKMSDVTTFSVKVDGHEFGPFATGGEGVIYDALDECEYKNS